MSDDDRPKKSWREIDRARESGQRREDRPAKGGVGDDKSAAYRNYKSQLNRLFDGGAQANTEKVDEEALVKQLDSSDEVVVREGLALLERLHDEGKLKRVAAIKARLKTVQATIDDPEIRKKARELLERL